jgi:hypothetical protein
MKTFAVLVGCACLAVSASAAVRINEVLANGATALGGVFDGVELHNTGDTDVDISGYSLSDSLVNTRKFVFPANTIIVAHGFVSVTLDPAAVDSGFGLKASGDSAYLFDGNGFLVEGITFGLQTEDLSIGRVPDGSENWVLTAPTFGGTNALVALSPPSGLKINEWMADPAGGDDYFEIYNTGTNPVALAGLSLSDSNAIPTFIPALSFIGAGRNGFQAFIADDDVAAGADHVAFKLGAGGDALRLADPAGPAIIDSISFQGQENDVSEGRLPDGADTFRRFPKHPTPGGPNLGLITNIIVNELLTHTDPPLEDAIELHNVTDQPVNIGGWFLSDRFSDLERYRFPDNTIIPARGYKVVYQIEIDGPGATAPFAFNSAHGGSVFLTQPDQSGVLVSYLERTFPPAENGVSFGRVMTSDGRTDFAALSCRSFGRDTGLPPGEAGLPVFRLGTGLTNGCGPKIGPVVISEIMFRPPDIITDVSTNDDALNEFVELQNITDAPVPLYDPAALTNHWKLGNGIDYEFSATDVIPAGGFLLVVNFDPNTNATQLAAFRARYSVADGVPIRGPYSGKLANSGETIELFKPDPPQGPQHTDEGFVPYILVEKVRYRDSAPWPTNASGTGLSLQRSTAIGYGNDPANWFADEPTAGFGNAHEITITRQPVNQLVLVSNATTLVVEARGTAPTFQWFRNKKKILGATNTWLTLSNATAKKTAGIYSVLVTNLLNSVMSSTASVQVITPVSIRAHPKSRTVVEGKKPAFLVRAKGTQPLTYQWLQNGAPIPGATRNRLVITNVMELHEGSYTVTVSNVLSGAVSQPATLTVNPPP